MTSTSIADRCEEAVARRRSNRLDRHVERGVDTDGDVRTVHVVVDRGRDADDGEPAAVERVRDRGAYDGANRVTARWIDHDPGGKGILRRSLLRLTASTQEFNLYRT